MADVISPDETFDLITNDLGNFEVSNQAIAKIVALAAAEISGVQILPPGIKIPLWSKDVPLGIEVRKNTAGDRFSVRIDVKMAYNTPMWETTQRLQRSINDAVERMTGKPLERVDVKVFDVYIAEAKAEEPEAED